MVSCYIRLILWPTGLAIVHSVLWTKSALKVISFRTSEVCVSISIISAKLLQYKLLVSVDLISLQTELFLWLWLTINEASTYIQITSWNASLLFQWILPWQCGHAPIFLFCLTPSICYRCLKANLGQNVLLANDPVTDWVDKVNELFLTISMHQQVLFRFTWLHIWTNWTMQLIFHKGHKSTRFANEWNKYHSKGSVRIHGREV